MFELMKAEIEELAASKDAEFGNLLDDLTISIMISKVANGQKFADSNEENLFHSLLSLHQDNEQQDNEFFNKRKLTKREITAIKTSLIKKLQDELAKDNPDQILEKRIVLLLKSFNTVKKPIDYHPDWRLRLRGYSQNQEGKNDKRPVGKIPVIKEKETNGDLFLGPMPSREIVRKQMLEAAKSGRAGLAFISYRRPDEAYDEDGNRIPGIVVCEKDLEDIKKELIGYIPRMRGELEKSQSDLNDVTKELAKLNRPDAEGITSYEQKMCDLASNSFSDSAYKEVQKMNAKYNELLAEKEALDKRIKELKAQIPNLPKLQLKWIETPMEDHTTIDALTNEEITIEEIQRNAAQIKSLVDQGYDVYNGCFASAERGPFMTAAYLIIHENKTPYEATQAVKQNSKTAKSWDQLRPEFQRLLMLVHSEKILGHTTDQIETEARVNLGQRLYACDEYMDHLQKAKEKTETQADGVLQQKINIVTDLKSILLPTKSGETVATGDKNKKFDVTLKTNESILKMDRDSATTVFFKRIAFVLNKMTFGLVAKVANKITHSHNHFTFFSHGTEMVEKVEAIANQPKYTAKVGA